MPWCCVHYVTHHATLCTKLSSTPAWANLVIHSPLHFVTHHSLSHPCGHNVHNCITNLPWCCVHSLCNPLCHTTSYTSVHTPSHPLPQIAMQTRCITSSRCYNVICTSATPFNLPYCNVGYVNQLATLQHVVTVSARPCIVRSLHQPLALGCYTVICMHYITGSTSNRTHGTAPRPAGTHAQARTAQHTHNKKYNVLILSSPSHTLIQGHAHTPQLIPVNNSVFAPHSSFSSGRGLCTHSWV